MKTVSRQAFDAYLSTIHEGIILEREPVLFFPETTRTLYLGAQTAKEYAYTLSPKTQGSLVIYKIPTRA